MFKIKTMIVCVGFVFILLTSCNNAAETSTVKTEITKSKLEEAKETVRTIFGLIDKVDVKEITKEQFDLEEKRLQNHLDSLRLALTAEEIKEFDSYKTQMMSEAVEKKMIRHLK